MPASRFRRKLSLVAFGKENQIMLHTLKTIVRDEDAATMVEYGLLVALIAMVALVGVTTLGSNLSGLFNSVSSSV